MCSIRFFALATEETVPEQEADGSREQEGAGGSWREQERAAGSKEQDGQGAGWTNDQEGAGSRREHHKNGAISIFVHNKIPILLSIICLGSTRRYHFLGIS